MRKTIFVIIIILSFFIMTNVSADTTFIKGITTESNVALRSDPNNDASRVKNDINNNVLLSNVEGFEILDETINYFKVYVQNNGYYYTGYVPKIYSKKVGTYTVKDETVNQLRNQGFPESYATKLAILKTINPKWSFIPYNTGLDFNHVIAKQATPVSRSLINSSNSALYSTEDGSLLPDGTFQKFDNGNWYAASRQTIGYYLDPRNFFNEDHMFMFETLQYNKDAHHLTTPAINEVARATFMEHETFACKEGLDICPNSDQREPKKYAEIFIEAGMKHDVNPVHLITRVYQEQGLNGKSAIISGNGYDGKYIGYYNHFNIAASGNKAGEIVEKALEWAESQKWNSPYAAIVGGTKAIRNWYITPKSGYDVGQDTVYFQKFDVVDPASFLHQYMQNITAPYSEANQTYRAYMKGEMNLPFTFRIPIYNNMPAYTTLGASGSDDANLSSLNVSGCNLMPSFTSGATSYSCTVPKNASSVVVSATAASGSAQGISGTGIINLPNIENSIEVIVTSGNGKTKTYTIKIIKKDNNEYSPDDILSSLKINNNSGTLSGFNIGTLGKDLVNNIKSAYPSSSVSISNNNKLGTGTKLTINNNGSKTYNVLIYGDNNGDGVIDILDLLLTQKHILGANKLQDVYNKATDVNKDGVIDIIDLLIIQKNILGTGKIYQ